MDANTFFIDFSSLAADGAVCLFLVSSSSLLMGIGWTGYSCLATDFADLSSLSVGFPCSFKSLVFLDEFSRLAESPVPD